MGEQAAVAVGDAAFGGADTAARLLANKLVQLEVVESVSEDTILRVLKKVTSSRGRRSRGACPRA